MSDSELSLPGRGGADPRLRGFRERVAVGEVESIIDARVRPLATESVVLMAAHGRVLGESIVATYPVPHFERAAMDGHALRGEETSGADRYTPAVFRVIGRSRPGVPFGGELGIGEAVEIATGAPVPRGADCVVRVESTRRPGGEVLVEEPTPPGRHVGRVGEDVAVDALVLGGGRVLRPQDLGVLSVLGRLAVEVVRLPRVTIVVTGDELLPAGSVPGVCAFADMNSPMLAALVSRDGGVARVVGPVRDERSLLREAIAEAARTSDLVIVSGGSSTGPEDHAPTLVAELGELAAHGVSLRPASPTGLGFVGGTAVLLAPGNPVSCLCAYDFFGGRIVRRLGGRPESWPYPARSLPLAEKLVSAIGRVDYARVRVEGGRVVPLAISGASILSSTTRADGFVIVPAELEGHGEGSMVTVCFYDPVGGVPG